MTGGEVTAIAAGTALTRAFEVGLFVDLTPYQEVILYGYAGGLFMCILGYAGFRWPTRTMKLAALTTVHGPVQRPSDMRVWLYRWVSAAFAGIGLFLLVWTTGEWM